MIENLKKLRCWLTGQHRFIKSGKYFICIDCGIIKEARIAK